MDNVYKICDERFSVEQIDNYDLVLEVSPKKFQFILKKSDNQMIMWLEDYFLGINNDQATTIAKIDSIIKKHEFLAANFWHSVKVNISTPFYSVIPDELFNPEFSERYLHILFPKLNLEEYYIEVENFKFNKSNYIYALPKTLKALLNATYSDLKIENVQLNYLNYAAKNSNLRQFNLLIFDLTYLTAIYFETKKSQLRMEKITLDSPNMDNFINAFLKEGQRNSIIYGEITPYSLIYRKLEHITSKIQWGKSPQNAVLSQYFDDLPEHRYLSLFLN